MKYTYILLLLCLLILSADKIFAKNEIYKCLDQYGRPTYSTQATCAKPETVQTSNTKNKRSKKTKVNSEERKNNIRQCKNSKKTLTTYKKALFLTKMINHNGKEIKVRLNKEEQKKALIDAENEVEYWCSKTQ